MSISKPRRTASPCLRSPSCMPLRTAAMVGMLMAAGISQAADTPALSCQARSSTTATTVVELYTSEGCSSCPPADRWLSSLKNRPDMLALAFHVDYWDRLGWADRFASAGATQRQRDLAALAGRSGVYTPQVIVGGQDWRSWPRLPAEDRVPAASRPSPISVSLVRNGQQVIAEVSAAETSGLNPALRYAGYWAVLEDGHQSQVRAGENDGQTLRHDHVVRLYQPVASWRAVAGLKTTLEVSAGVPEHPRRVAFVVTDAATAKPLQAAALGC